MLTMDQLMNVIFTIDTVHTGCNHLQLGIV